MNSHSGEPQPATTTPLPRFLYGTAWKEENTRRLTELALAEGFRGIDTANQRRHYHEAAVGEAIQAAIASGKLTRDDLFLQSKYTFQGGQDHRLPYDPQAPIATQVVQSFASTLEHFGVATLDSYLLHGPTVRKGLSAADWEAWGAIERLHQEGRTKYIGVSNVALDQLQLLCDKATVAPHFVQNRCYAVQRWDQKVRELCAARGILYQGFSLLTANAQLLMDRRVQEIADRYGKTLGQIAFRFALEVGMLPLTGTTSAEHMRADLDIFDFRLDADEIRLIENLAD